MSSLTQQQWFVTAYNFARMHPGWASISLFVSWPLFVALAAVAVVLSPILFPGAMIAAYMLKQTNAPELKMPEPPAPAAAPAPVAAAAPVAAEAPAAAAPVDPLTRGTSYYDLYPEVRPKAELRKCPSAPPTRSHSPSIFS
jgi:hypothetical protein